MFDDEDYEKSDRHVQYHHRYDYHHDHLHNHEHYHRVKHRHYLMSPLSASVYAPAPKELDPMHLPPIRPACRVSDTIHVNRAYPSVDLHDDEEHIFDTLFSPDNLKAPRGMEGLPARPASPRAHDNLADIIEQISELKVAVDDASRKEKHAEPKPRNRYTPALRDIDPIPFMLLLDHGRPERARQGREHHLRIPKEKHGRQDDKAILRAAREFRDQIEHYLDQDGRADVPRGGGCWLDGLSWRVLRQLHEVLGSAIEKRDRRGEERR